MKPSGRLTLKRKAAGFTFYTTCELVLHHLRGTRGDNLADCALYPAVPAGRHTVPARYQMVFIAARVIIFSLFMGWYRCRSCSKGCMSRDKQAGMPMKSVRRKRRWQKWRCQSISKMEERLSAESSDEALDAKPSSKKWPRVAGISSGVPPVMMRWKYNLRGRSGTPFPSDYTARAERWELYRQRATRIIRQ